MSGIVPRTVRPDGSAASWVDTLGHDSLHDYDPLWARCVELGVVPAFHGIGYGWGSRVSPSNYVYNHLGNFAAAQEAACRSLVMAGVPMRHPELCARHDRRCPFSPWLVIGQRQAGARGVRWRAADLGRGRADPRRDRAQARRRRPAGTLHRGPARTRASPP